MSTDSGGREIIIETSAKLFNQQGYTGVSIRDIAQACGVTNAALYYHFKNKDELFLAVTERSHATMMASLNEAAQPTGDVREDLRRLLGRYADMMSRQRQSFQTLWRDLSQLGNARGEKLFGEMRVDILRPLQQLIEAAQAKGDLKPGDSALYARLLHSMVIALTHGGKPGRTTRPTSDKLDVVLDVFLQGVQKTTTVTETEERTGSL